MKTCRHCGVEKKLEEFRHRNANEKHCFYYEAICKDCDRARVTNFQRTAKGIVSKIYARQRNSSVQRGHPMPSYSLDELRAWVHGQEIFWKLHEQWVAGGFAKKLTPSLDRIDNSKPYELSNLRIVTWKENHAKYSEDVKNHTNCSNTRFRPVIQLDLNGKILNEYPSGALAARATNARTSGIMAAAQGISDTSKGFRWVYKDEYNPNDLKWKKAVPDPRLKVAVIQLDLHGNVVDRYNSLSAANRATGICRRGIVKQLNKPKLFCGFYWQDEKFFCESNNVSIEEAAQMWNGSSLQLINKTNPLLIGFGGNK